MNANQNFLAWRWVALLIIATVFQVKAQVSTKYVYATPSGFAESHGLFLRPTTDGGHILTGTAIWGNYGGNIPRAVKIDANGAIEWENTYYIQGQSPSGSGFGRSQPSEAAMPLPVGGYLMSISDDSTSNDLLRIADDGALLYHLALPLNNVKLLKVESDGYWISGYGQQPQAVAIQKLDFNDSQLVALQVTVAGAWGIDAAAMPNGDFVVMHQTANNKFVYTRIDASGNQLWQTAPTTNGGQSIVAISDGGFAVCRPYNGFNLFRFDSQGALQWTAPVNLIAGYAERIQGYDDGSLLVSGQTLANRGYMARIATDGSIVWLAQAPTDNNPDVAWLSGFPTQDGWAVGTGYTVTPNQLAFVSLAENTGLFINYVTGRVAKDDDYSCTVESTEAGLSISHVSASNGVESFHAFAQTDGSYEMYLPAGQYSFTAYSYQPFFALCDEMSYEVNFPASQSNSAQLDFPMQTPEPIHHISGKVTLDDNGNCTFDDGETPMVGWSVRISDGSNTIHTTTDVAGLYSYFVPDGNYQISVTPINPNFGICTPVVQNISFAAATGQSATANFSANRTFECGFMQAYVSNFQMRPCTSTTIYAGYQNVGTVTVEGASMVVTLDPMLTFVSAGITPVSVDGQVLTFDLGDVPPGSPYQYQAVAISVNVSCEAQIDQQLCVAAEVYPDTICFNAPNWNGAIVAVEGICVDDSEARFKVKNIGTAPNSVQLNYVIIEDQIVLLSNGFQLNPGDSTEISVPADGDPLTIVADQEPGYPGSPEVSYTVTNCNGFNTTPVFLTGPAGPFSTQSCFTVTNSYDPNDKTATPQGFGDDHAIEPGTPLEYRIRFQNTGNDTAFLVVIRDTLSPFLDPRTVQPGLSSHPYEYFQINDSILHFAFRNIMLPDSTTNLEGSQGFVNFRVRQRADVPLGSVIENTAAIYFDFNDPVLTNTTWNTVREYLVVSVDQPSEFTTPERVKVYPNPMEETARIELLNAPNSTYGITIMDATGKILIRDTMKDQVYTFSRNNLPGGIYFWQVSVDGAPWASGKVMVSKQ